MARTATAEKANAPPQAAPQKIMKVCGTCWAWAKLPNAPTFGQCKASHGGMMAMMHTTDLTTCSLWPAPKFDPDDPSNKR